MIVSMRHFAKAHVAAGDRLPSVGKAFISVRDADKSRAGFLARKLIEIGFELVATGGTCEYLKSEGITCESVNKVMEGQPNIVDMIKNDAIAFIVNTTERSTSDHGFCNDSSFSVKPQGMLYDYSGRWRSRLFAH